MQKVEKSCLQRVCDAPTMAATASLWSRLRPFARPAAAGLAAAASFAAASSLASCEEVAEQPPRLLRWLGFTASAPAALVPWEWRPLKVWAVEQVSPNTKKLIFAFPDYHAVAAMDVASCLIARAFVGKERADGSRAAVIRPYTPSHTTVGYLELVVKVYGDGKMSSHIGSLKPGDKLEFKGPILKLPIVTNEFESVGLVAGGTGITPMLQVRSP